MIIILFYFYIKESGGPGIALKKAAYPSFSYADLF